MSGPLKSLFNVATTSLLAVAPPPRVASMLRKGRGSGRRILSPRQTTSETNHVVILGGGFGGLYTALRLHDLNKQENDNEEILKITLIDVKDKFVFSPLLYELATSKAETEEVSPFYSDLLKNTNINFIQGYVKDVQLKTNQVFIDISKMNGKNKESDGEVVLDYNQLVVALGSESSNTRQVKGVDQYALPFYTVDDALWLREQMTLLKSTNSDHDDGSKQIVVVGGGYIGVELACNLSEALHDTPSTSRSKVKLIVGPRGVLPNSNSPSLQNKAMKSLETAQVELCYQEVLEVKEGTVTLRSINNDENNTNMNDKDINNDNDIVADLIIWTAGSKPNKLIQECFPNYTNLDGRLKVDKTLMLGLGLDDQKGAVFALGDVSVCEKPLPASAQVVFQQSEYVAWNIWSLITGSGNMLNFQFTPLGEVLALGERNAVVMAPHQMFSDKEDDSLSEMSGALGSFLRRSIYSLRMPTTEQRKQAFVGYVNSSLRTYHTY